MGSEGRFCIVMCVQMSIHQCYSGVSLVLWSTGCDIYLIENVCWLYMYVVGRQMVYYATCRAIRLILNYTLNGEYCTPRIVSTM